MKLPEPTEGAYRVLAYAIVLFGIMNLFPNPNYENHYHRYPAGRTAGIFYIVAAAGYLFYSYSRKSKDNDKP